MEPIGSYETVVEPSPQPINSIPYQNIPSLYQIFDTELPPKKFLGSYMSHGPSISPFLVRSFDNIRLWTQIMKFLIIQLLPDSLFFLSLIPKYSPQQSVPKHLQCMFFP
jgi:hypothetical protein